MADAVTTRTISNTRTHIIVHLTNISDGTGESAVIKVDKSTLLAEDDNEPASLDIEQVRWAIQGFTSVRILWDHTTDDTALVLNNNGYDDFRNINPYIHPRNDTSSLADPRSSGGTGDIILTTAGAASGATYDITLWIRKKAI